MSSTVVIALLRSTILEYEGVGVIVHSPSDTDPEDAGLVATPFSAWAPLQDLELNCPLSKSCENLIPGHLDDFI
jgi:hypothetical protein